MLNRHAINLFFSLLFCIVLGPSFSKFTSSTPLLRDLDQYVIREYTKRTESLNGYP